MGELASYMELASGDGRGLAAWRFENKAGNTCLLIFVSVPELVLTFPSNARF